MVSATQEENGNISKQWMETFAYYNVCSDQILYNIQGMNYLLHESELVTLHAI